MKIGSRFARSSCFLIVFAFFLIALEMPSSGGLGEMLFGKKSHTPPAPTPQALFDKGKYAEARDGFIKESQCWILSTRETTPARIARGVSEEIGERIHSLGMAIRCCEKLNETAKSQREKDSNQNQIESLAKELLRIGKSPYVYETTQPSLYNLWYWEDGRSEWPYKGETEEPVINSVLFSYTGELSYNPVRTIRFDGGSFDQIFEEARKAKKRFETVLDSCPSSPKADLVKALYYEKDGMRDRLDSLLKVTQKAYFTDVAGNYPGGTDGVKVEFVNGRKGFIPNYNTCYDRLMENEDEFRYNIRWVESPPKVNKVDLKLSSEAEAQIEKARSILKESPKEEGGALQTIGE